MDERNHVSPSPGDSMSQQHDVIVIGSGIGGLTAALTAARKGRSVLVLEAAKQFGGYINPFRRGGYHFDPGIHYIGEAGEGQSFRNLLDKLGLDEIRFSEMDPDGFDWYVFPEYQVRNCKGLDRFHDRLRADFPRESRGLERLLQAAASGDRRHAHTHPSAQAYRRAPAGALSGGDALGLGPRSRTSSITTSPDPALKAALAGPCGDLGLPPGRVYGLAHLCVLAHYAQGAYVPHGGSGALRDAYVAGLRAQGATLKRNTPVARILHEGGRTLGVETAAGEIFEARTVISNAQGTLTYRMLGLEHLTRRQRRKVDGCEQSLGSLCIFLGVHGQVDTSQLGSANLWHYDRLDIDEAYAQLRRGDPSDGGCFFMSVSTNKDPEGQLAPDGNHVVELVTLAPPEPFQQCSVTSPCAGATSTTA